MYFSSHFHLIYGPATTVLCTKIAFFYYFIEPLLSSRHAVASPSQQMSYSILPSAFSCMKHPTFFGLVLKFSQICAPFLFFPCFHLFLYHCIISCHFLLEKNLTKWGVYLRLPIGLTFFSPSQTSSVTKSSSSASTSYSNLSACPITFLYVSCTVLIFPFISLDNKNVIKP